MIRKNEGNGGIFSVLTIRIILQLGIEIENLKLMNMTREYMSLVKADVMIISFNKDFWLSRISEDRDSFPNPVF